MDPNAPEWDQQNPPWPNTDEFQPAPQHVPLPQTQPGTDIIRELANAISVLGRDAEGTRALLAQQSEMLHLMHSQLQQSSQDSAELARRIADHAATAFQSLAGAGISGSLPSPSCPPTVKVRELRMFSGKADEVKPFVREVKACIQLQRGVFATDEDRTLYFSLYLKSGATESWYNAVCINEKALLHNFNAFI